MIKNIIFSILALFLFLNMTNISWAEEDDSGDIVMEEDADDTMDMDEEDDDFEENDSMDEGDIAGASVDEEDVEDDSVRPKTVLDEEASLNYRGLNIRPSLKIQEKFTDNIFSKDIDKDEKEDYITITSLGLKLSLEKWGHYIEAKGTAVNKSYNEHIEEESTERFAYARLILMKDELLEFNFKGMHIDSFEDRDDQILARHVLLLPNSRQEHYINTKLTGGASLNFGRQLRLDVDYYLERWDFDDIDNKFRERKVGGVDVKATLANGKDSYFVAEYNMKEIDYQVINTLSSIGLDNREHTGYLGFKWDESKYKGLLRIGGIKKVYNDINGFKSFYGLDPNGKEKYIDHIKSFEAVGDLEIYHKLGESHEIVYGVKRYMDEPMLAPTALANSLGSLSTPQKYVMVNEAHLGYRYFFTKNTSINWNGSYASTKFSDTYVPGEKIRREDRVVTAGMGVRYEIDWITIGLDYEYKSRESNVSDPGGDDLILPDETFDFIGNTTIFTVDLHL